MRRAPLLQRGGWGFESLTADTPSKLSQAEQPPCKRKAVGSIPTWGSSPPRSPTWQRHPAQNRTSRGSNPRGGTGGGGTPWFPHRPPPSGRTPPCAWSASRPAKPASGVTARTTWQGRPFPGAGPGVPSRRLPCRSLTRCDVVQWQDVRLLPGERWFDPGRRSAFLGRLTAGSSALNRRMRGSNPARGARSYGRGHGVQAVSNAAGEGSIPSVRARSSSRHAPVV